MATSIHHGAPGSFKSFTLVQRFAIDALKAGRVVVTNIRGLTSLQRILDQFPDYVFPDTADLIHINTEIAEGRAVMAGWFHWVPFGALVLMDEGQRIYPDRRDFKMESLDTHVSPAGYLVNDIHVEITDDYTGQSYTIGRPEDAFTAFDMQRHYQWDVFISTTHINKIQKPIREVSQTAYLHKSLSGKLPFLFKDTWYEFQHDPETTGKSEFQRIGKPRKYKADQRIFNCYQSTATGEHTESKADQSILGDTGVRFKLAIIVLAIGGGIVMLFRFSETHHTFGQPVVVPVSVDQEAVVAVSAPVKDHLPAPISNVVRNVPVQQGSDFTAHLGYKLLAISHHDLDDKLHGKLRFVVDSVDGLKDVTYQQLSRAGYTVFVYGLCHLSLVSSDGTMHNYSCDSAEISKCSVRAQTQNSISLRNCEKYGQKQLEPSTTAAINNNALVAVAASSLGGGNAQ